ncbi:hypothetical protein EYR36_005284 [Pleurotus pulmonarius]|nr:hypothetical protein EYR36_005284 [Pleurotus pulmonarius]
MATDRAMADSQYNPVATEEVATPSLSEAGDSKWLPSSNPPMNTPTFEDPPSLKDTQETSSASAQSSSRKRILTFVILGICICIIIVAAVAIPVLLTQYFKKRNQSSDTSSATTSATPTTSLVLPDGPLPTAGTDGSLIQMDNGELFMYSNGYGGDWATNPDDPFAPGGKAQSWSKRVGSEEWVWGTDVIRGVNLGGWLVTEPFIVPALYEKYASVGGFPVIDEWMLCIAMGKNVEKELHNHYATFITERDFAEIAAAGLNWVRIPIGFWAIGTMEHEPFLESASWTYFLKAIEWARKYGLRIYLDLHALPGSQNGWNHSGKGGSINFMNGVMGIANAQRTLTYIRILTEFVSQEQYRDVVCMLGIVNEILWKTIGQTSIESFYYAAYDTVRNATGLGTGNGPYVALHDAFQGLKPWENFLSGSDRVVIDQHPYLAFWKDNTLTLGEMVDKPCEWALATNHVAEGNHRLNGVGSTPTNADCARWDDWERYDQATIDNLKKVTLASMDALQNFFFWTWKIGNSTNLQTSSSPLWHYKLGLQRGWIPKDPREAAGHCASVLQSSDVFDGRHPATATGGAGAGTLSANQARAFPPATLSPSFSGTQMTLLPTYTPTGTVKTLFAPTFTLAPSATVGTGWTNVKDQGLAYVPVNGCDYPNLPQYLLYTMRFFVVLPFLLAAIALARPVEDNEDGFFGSKKKTPSLKDGLLGAAAPVIAIGKETSV